MTNLTSEEKAIQGLIRDHPRLLSAKGYLYDITRMWAGLNPWGVIQLGRAVPCDEPEERPVFGPFFLRGGAEGFDSIGALIRDDDERTTPEIYGGQQEEDVERFRAEQPFLYDFMEAMFDAKFATGEEAARIARDAMAPAPETPLSKLRTRIKWLARQGLTQELLAQLSTVGARTIRDIVAEASEPRPETIKKLNFGMDIYEFYYPFKYTDPNPLRLFQDAAAEAEDGSRYTVGGVKRVTTDRASTLADFDPTEDYAPTYNERTPPYTLGSLPLHSGTLRPLSRHERPEVFVELKRAIDDGRCPIENCPACRAANRFAISRAPRVFDPKPPAVNENLYVLDGLAGVFSKKHLRGLAA